MIRRIKLLLGAILVITSEAYAFTDMIGRSVDLPNIVNKVYAPSPYGSYILYAMDPALMAGWVMNVPENHLAYLSPKVRELPVIGSISGQGQTSNIETLLAHKPDLILMWASNEPTAPSKVDEKLNQIGVPYAYALASSLRDYPKVFTFLGELLHREQRGEILSKATQKILDDIDHAVAFVPENKRPKVYYAEEKDGLSTECDDSIHVETLKLLGDVNVHRCHTSNHKGFEKVTIEQILLYNPDIIITQDQTFFDNVWSAPLWKNVAAVQNKRIYLIPTVPFNWFDRPPSFMRFLGLQWLANLLYPDYYPLDIAQETRNFYRLFLGIDLNESDLQTVLSSKSLPKKE